MSDNGIVKAIGAFITFGAIFLYWLNPDKANQTIMLALSGIATMMVA